nr:sorting nexin-4 [Pelodiscus sinensis]|eukprot:XP_006114952.1 sorting nexin-4 [Pelodiscus sinensis]
MQTPSWQRGRLQQLVRSIFSLRLSSKVLCGAEVCGSASPSVLLRGPGKLLPLQTPPREPCECSCTTACCVLCACPACLGSVLRLQASECGSAALRRKRKGSLSSTAACPLIPSPSLQTNLPIFKLKESCVRRRYSDFEWLKNELERDSKIVVPPLPGKALKRQLPFRGDEGIFEESFIEERRQGLEQFINKIAGHPLAQNERCLHMFLQEETIDRNYVPGKVRQ